MNLAPFLLDIIACPQTQRRLAVADGALLEKINAAIDKGKLKDKRGDVVGPRLQGALVRDDKEVVYPVWDDVPDLTVEGAIELSQLRGI